MVAYLGQSGKAGTRTYLVLRMPELSCKHDTLTGLDHPLRDLWHSPIHSSYTIYTLANALWKTVAAKTSNIVWYQPGVFHLARQDLTWLITKHNLDGLPNSMSVGNFVVLEGSNEEDDKLFFKSGVERINLQHYYSAKIDRRRKAILMSAPCDVQKLLHDSTVLKLATLVQHLLRYFRLGGLMSIIAFLHYKPLWTPIGLL